MPRPGPRPYECVKRAWHSERHRPIRGSIIQEIFRVANDVHSAATRKNNEWQEKLPVVVLKAEEIMYSKANSEAEYADLSTLPDRVNDAIDTIIRKEDDIEIGDLLLPCIEAALNLGCVARRVSKSQHRSNPACYLRPNPGEVGSASLKMSDVNRANLGHLVQTVPDSSSLQNSVSELPSWYTTLFKPTNMTSNRIPEMKSNNYEAYHAHRNSSSINALECPISKGISSPPCIGRMSAPVTSFACPNLAGAYTMHYNENHSGVAYRHQIAEDARYHVAIATVNGETFDNPESSLTQSLVSCKTNIGSSKPDSAAEKTSSVSWDLSLRLGLPSPSSLGGEGA